MDDEGYQLHKGSQLHEGSTVHGASSVEYGTAGGGGGSDAPTPSGHIDTQRSVKSVQRAVQMGSITPRSGEHPFVYAIIRYQPSGPNPSYA